MNSQAFVAKLEAIVGGGTEIKRLRALLVEAKSMLVHYSRYPPPLEDGNHQFYHDVARIDDALEKR